MNATTKSPLLTAFQDSNFFPHPVKDIRILETHISWVILTGHYAYKLKKPVNLGFADFSTLEKRHFYCLEELRLNQRLAPTLYLEVLPITGSPERPILNGAGHSIEYTLKMREFPQTTLLSCCLDRGEVRNKHIDLLAEDIAEFHSSSRISDDETRFGNPDMVRRPLWECLDHLAQNTFEESQKDQIHELDSWMKHLFSSSKDMFALRKREGFIRECHGDLHMGNMALLHERITVFDCIEFNEALRWIDVLSEIAFFVMDLKTHGQTSYSYRFLNHYLERTGDYKGLRFFRFYEVYRALVRAKVTAIRMKQILLNPDDKLSLQREFQRYLNWATRLLQTSSPALIIMHGLSGSGKTTLSQHLLEQLGIIRLRSDVERKRLFGLKPEERSGQDRIAEIYGADATQATYARLRELAKSLLDAGFPVIVDATFLQRQDRTSFFQLAQPQGIPFFILHIETPEQESRQRLLDRERGGLDASDANLSVWKTQDRNQEPLDNEERPFVLKIDSTNPDHVSLVIQELRKIWEP